MKKRGASAPTTQRTGTEWVGGIITMPAYIEEEGASFRPEVIIWIDERGAVLGTRMSKPGEMLGQASESLRDTIRSPMIGHAHAPARLRVASPALVEALRAGHPGIELVCAPTPEIDAVLAAMVEKLSEDAEPSQFSPDVRLEALAALFRAAAELFRAKPWKIVPSDQNLVSVSIDKLGVTDMAVSVIGQLGESFGFVMFSGIADFEAYLDAAEAAEHGERPAMPPHTALSFERGTAMSAIMRAEIAEHRWEIAGANAYPWLMAIDQDLIHRPLTERDVMIATAVALALARSLGDKKALLAAWSHGEPVARTLSIPLVAGDMDVSLRIPYEQMTRPSGADDDVISALADLGQDGDEIDPELRSALENELVRQFLASPEARPVIDVQSCHLVMSLAADYFGVTIASITARELRQIVFEIIPQKVSIQASAARSIIEDNRAFYAFLKRAFALAQADACLRVLGGDAVTNLTAALLDTRQFGMAKSLVMAGSKAGFDMQSKEGIEAWMQVMQSAPLPASFPLPSPAGPTRRPDKAATRVKKTQRTAARKARKKSR